MGSDEVTVSTVREPGRAGEVANGGTWEGQAVLAAALTRHVGLEGLKTG